ncbi:MAG: TetR/AcrR family transcriptional regulator [Rhodobacteraceae bacterium]|nr:TetR/AcrR family transcriptional regulator [Paracoccaceae bacterium]
MPAPKSRDTRDRILEVAAVLLETGGLGAVTFDAVAARLGVTKQAVIYWFPSKVALLSALALPGLRGEAQVAIEAAARASGPAEAARAVVRALIGFHLADLARFRLMYLSPQIGATAGARRTAAELVKQVHPVTDDMYSALADRLGGGPSARETAVAIHMAALGHVLMVALTEAIGDPLRQTPDALAERLAALLADGAGVDADRGS